MENGLNQSKSAGIAKRFVGIFVSPTETFQDISKKPAWWLPFIVVFVIFIALQIGLLDIHMSDGFKEKGMTDQEITQTTEQMSNPIVMIIISLFMILFISFIFLVVYIVISGLLLLGGNSIMGGKANYGQVLGVVTWSGLIFIIGEILKSVLIFSQGTSHCVTTSLAVLLTVPAVGSKPQIGYLLLRIIDPFMIWQTVLWAFGLAVVAKIKTEKAVIVAFSIFAIEIALIIGLSLLSGKYF